MREKPGIHKSALSREVGVGWGTVSYHIEALRRAGQVSCERRGRQTVFFAAGTEQEGKALLRALRDDLDATLLSTLHEAPRSRLADLSQRLEVNRKVVRKHLQDLQDDGLVHSTDGPYPRYFLNAEAREGLVELLPRRLLTPDAPRGFTTSGA